MNPYDDDFDEIYSGDGASMKEVETKDGDVVVTLSADALQRMAAAVQYEVIQRLSVSIEKAVRDSVKEMVDEAVRKVIGQKAEALVLEELQKPRQKFDTWGNPVGATVAFADLIPGVVANYLGEHVDEKGNRSGYSGDQKRTRAGWIIGQYVKADLDPAVQNAVSSITKQARDIVTAKVSAFVAEQMIPAVDVKTIGRPS